MTNPIHRANARSPRVPSIVLRVLLALVAGAIILALLVPALVRRGIPLQGWMAWGVILLVLALVLAPEAARRIGKRD